MVLFETLNHTEKSQITLKPCNHASAFFSVFCEFSPLYSGFSVSISITKAQGSNSLSENADS